MRFLLPLFAAAFSAGMVLGALVPPPIEVAVASLGICLTFGLAALVIWRV